MRMAIGRKPPSAELTLCFQRDDLEGIPSEVQIPYVTLERFIDRAASSEVEDLHQDVSESSILCRMNQQ